MPAEDTPSRRDVNGHLWLQGMSLYQSPVSELHCRGQETSLSATLNKLIIHFLIMYLVSVS